MKDMPPSNETIFALLSEFKTENSKEHKVIINWLKQTNGKVMVNTKFRWLILGGFTVVTILVLPILFKFYL